MARTMRLAEAELQDVFTERGWSDGLPVVAPTPERVGAMLAESDLLPEDVLGVVPGRSAVLTAEMLAANAVMAGAVPEYFPIVQAAMAALLDPAFNLNAALTSTGGAALTVVVSGPLADRVGVHGGHNALGPGFRANATIGRTLRLVARNVFDARPGGMDGSSLGNPGRYALCFAEAPPPQGWEPLHVRLGYEPDDTSVTVMATEGPHQVANHLNGDPGGILATMASAMASPTSFIAGKGGQAMFVLGPEHAAALAGAGLTPREVQEHLAAASRIAPQALLDAGVRIPVGSAHDMTAGPDGLLPVVKTADDVLLVTAGGAGAGWSAYLPSWATSVTTAAVSRRVRDPHEALPDCGDDVCAVDF
ncbi:hypothetical protein E1293_13430 [Actinomadura darangshiensis]|uniref:Thioredoxin n=1 Tax=Actinomadura darangshiensis TaxID=705336 RepID=A0A4R5BFI5_9ACTN|nr:hypothetical protein [Actinomadura darangshiensis]TDD84169.1 hypothetical protein E1293_13430 [Actinomadura darangshiensis]